MSGSMIDSVRISQHVVRARITPHARTTNVSIRSNNRVKAVFVGIQGPAGPEGAAGGDTPMVAASTLSGHRAVVSVSATEIGYADNDTPSHSVKVLGIIKDAANAGGTVMVQTFRSMTEPSWDWTPGQPIFLGNNGMLTQTVPATGFILELGVAISPQTIWIDIKQAISLA